MNAIIIIDKQKTVIECSYENYIDDICDKFTKQINIKKNEMIFFIEEKELLKILKLINL